MNRFCELKLVDIVRGNSSKRKKNKTESDTYCNEILVKKLRENEKGTNNIGNIVICSKIGDTFRDAEKSTEQRITRSSNRKSNTNSGYKKSSKEQLVEKRVFEQISSSKYLKNNENINPQLLQSKIKTKTEKKQPEVRLSRDNLKNNKGCFVKNRISDSLNNAKNLNENTTQNKGNRRQKRNTHKSFWESKLTGARRVSKRLTNLKNKIKIARKLETCLDTNPKLYETKNSIKLKVEYETKAAHHVSYSMNRNEQKSNYGKLNQTSKLYPRVAPTRRTSTGRRRKIKSIILPKLSDIRKPLNVLSEDNQSKNQEACSDKEENINSNVCLTDKKDICELILKETHEPPTELAKSKDLNGKDETNEPEISDAVIENTIIPTQKSEQNDCVSEIIAESLSSSEVMVIDLESGENVLQLECEVLAQNLNFVEVSEEIKGQEPEQVPNLTPCNEIVPDHDSIRNSEQVYKSGKSKQFETDTATYSVKDNTVEGRLVKEDVASSGDLENNMEATIKKLSSLNEVVGK